MKQPANNRQNKKVQETKYDPYIPTDKTKDVSQIHHTNQPENTCKPEKWIVLIINTLSIKTHETTGKQPAKPEMK